MNYCNALRPIDAVKISANKTITEVSITPGDLSNPTILKLIEQGGTIASLILICLFIWLLTKLIKAAKDD
jgi:hypothetical protein